MTESVKKLRTSKKYANFVHNEEKVYNYNIHKKLKISRKKKVRK